jgi:hypothetical protein
MWARQAAEASEEQTNAPRLRVVGESEDSGNLPADGKWRWTPDG